jgi:hypothetical protein
MLLYRFARSMGEADVERLGRQLDAYDFMRWQAYDQLVADMHTGADLGRTVEHDLTLARLG